MAQLVPHLALLTLVCTIIMTVGIAMLETTPRDYALQARLGGGVAIGGFASLVLSGFAMYTAMSFVPV
jgi:hypothetical protein